MMMLVGGMTMVICCGIIMGCTFMQQQEWMVMLTRIVPFAFLLGAVIYVVAQRGLRTETSSMTLRRLYGIQFLSGICFIIAGLLMIENFCHLLQPFVVTTLDSYFTYVQVVHNNWVVALLIGAVLQMYTVHRIGAELRKDS